RRLPGDEAPELLREAVREEGPPEGRGRAPRPQAGPQACPARRRPARSALRGRPRRCRGGAPRPPLVILIAPPPCGALRSTSDLGIVSGTYRNASNSRNC